jgi:ATP-binding cassette subfamily B protein
VGLAQLRAVFALVFSRAAAIADASLYLADIDRLATVADQEVPPATDGPAREGPFRSVRLDGIGYTYPGSAVPALSGITLDIAVGELVAVVGRNGSGKSTLTKIVAGLLPPIEGTVLWNGEPYPDDRTVQQSMTSQFQDPTRWCFTVRENVRLGDTTRDGAASEVVDSLRKAGADELVARLPLDVNTRLGKELGPGSDLSGGQWQRIALARCFYRNSGFVIFDEPTSAMDANAEAAFLESFRDLLGGRTGILVTHRFSSLRLVDRIYVLDEGRLVEQGTHESLVQHDGVYADLYRTQLRNLVALDDTNVGR